MSKNFFILNAMIKQQKFTENHNYFRLTKLRGLTGSPVAFRKIVR